MSAQHTPGPWHVMGGVLVCGGNPEHLIADAALGRPERQEDHDNARLIATAPELLAALRVFVELHERGAWPGTEDITAGRAAIAKATQE
jgi:hypothetical protein